LQCNIEKFCFAAGVQGASLIPNKVGQGGEYFSICVVVFLSIWKILLVNREFVAMAFVSSLLRPVGHTPSPSGSGVNPGQEGDTLRLHSHGGRWRSGLVQRLRAWLAFHRLQAGQFFDHTLPGSFGI
jgi:hypothetical protein